MLGCHPGDSSITGQKWEDNLIYRLVKQPLSDLQPHSRRGAGRLTTNEWADLLGSHYPKNNLCYRLAGDISVSGMFHGWLLTDQLHERSSLQGMSDVVLLSCSWRDMYRVWCSVCVGPVDLLGRPAAASLEHHVQPLWLSSLVIFISTVSANSGLDGLCLFSRKTETTRRILSELGMNVPGTVGGLSSLIGSDRPSPM